MTTPEDLYLSYYDLSWRSGTPEFRIGTDKKVHLSPNETLFLSYLISNPEDLHFKKSLYVVVWGEDYAYGVNNKHKEDNLKVLVNRVRSKIGDTKIPTDKFPPNWYPHSSTFHWIQTDRGLGYRLRRVWDIHEIEAGVPAAG